MPANVSHYERLLLCVVVKNLQCDIWVVFYARRIEAEHAEITSHDVVRFEGRQQGLVFGAILSLRSSARTFILTRTVSTIGNVRQRPQVAFRRGRAASDRSSSSKSAVPRT